jgi:hypothetical protein
MFVVCSSLLVCCVLADDPEPKLAPKFPLGKETTYVTGPLDKEGYVDYEIALNDRLSKGITAEKNANVLLWAAFGPTPSGGSATLPAEFFKRLGIAEPPKTGDYFINRQAFIRDHLKLEPAESDTFHEQGDRATKRPWQAKDFPHIASWLKQNEKPLRLMVEATKRPEYYNPLIAPRKENEPRFLIGALLPSVQACREVAAALAARAMLRLDVGEFEEAWQDLLACHRLGRLVARGGTLIEGLVGIAIDQIASTADIAYLDRAKLTSKQILDRLKDLQALPPMPSIADKVDMGERFVYMNSLQNVVRHGWSVVENPAKKASEEELRFLAMIDWEPALRTANKWYERMAAALRLKTRAERLKELDSLERDLKALKKEAGDAGKLRDLMLTKPDKTFGKVMGDIFITLLMPAAGKVQDAADRAEQTQRNLHIAFSLAAYHRDNGRYPAKLDDLAPKYLSAIPDDLFSDKPLIYRATEKSFLVYSVGMNGKDDDGRGRDDIPPGDDQAVRLPLPELTKK